jgi:hypothetical protein
VQLGNVNVGCPENVVTALDLWPDGVLTRANSNFVTHTDICAGALCAMAGTSKSLAAITTSTDYA